MCCMELDLVFAQNKAIFVAIEHLGGMEHGRDNGMAVIACFWASCPPRDMPRNHVA